MALEPGSRLGPYELQGALGAGGMGEVYKGRDTRIDRIVAIKVLPSHMAANPDFRQRFDREARAISSLNHPNICSLYDIGHQDGIDFLVMEFLEGEPLSKLLEEGPIPTSELLRIAIQIADALDKAHKQGLVHRDLKPANIVLTKNGAKLLDFGLAKWQEQDAAGQVSELTRTSTPLTSQGTIVGTFQYMSPEQLEGKEADARSDLFSFGVVLYEMATGKRPFEGKSQASLIAAILKEEPRPISAMQPMSPPALERVVKQCLAKDPDDRWQTAGDLKRALEWTSEGGSQVGIPVKVSARRKTRERVLWGAAIVFAIATASLAFKSLTQKAPTKQVARFIIPSPKGLTDIFWPQISPDGNTIAFIARDTAGQSAIYIRPLNSLDAHLLVKTQSMFSRPFWSPDSKALAYFENNKLYKVSAGGGLAQLVCEAAFGSDGSWGKEGVIVFDGRSTDSLRQVPASGGTPVAASRLDHSRGEKMGAWPCFLPDGKHYLFVANKDSSAVDLILKVGKLNSFDAESLTVVNSRVQYSNGYLIYVRNRILVAQPFDANSLKIIGEAAPLSDRVTTLGALVYFSASENGTLVFEQGLFGGQNDIVSVNRQGDSLVQIGPPGNYSDFTLSPDNTRLAYGVGSDRPDVVDIWVRDLKRDVASRLTFGPGVSVWPQWSQDGSEILLTTNEDGGRFFPKRRRANGTGKAEKVFSLDTASVGLTSLSRDGTLMSFIVDQDRGDIWIYNATTKQAQPFLTEQYSETRGAISPDGKLIAYQSNETGSPEIYIRELSPSGGKWQVSTDHGKFPRWRPDGKELYFLGDDNRSFMAVSISYVNGLQIGTPIKLFEHSYYDSGGNATLCPYAPTNDGKRFYILAPADQAGTSEFVVVQNWTQEMKQ